MSISAIGLMVFLTLTSASTALFLVVRDMTSRRGGASRRGGTDPDDSETQSGPIHLQRVPRSSDDQPPSGPVGAFDRWFLGLLRETGMPLTPIAGTLLIVLSGAVVGGAVFIWDENPLAAVVGAFVGMGVALAVLMIRRAQHIKLLQEQVAPALDMLARGLRASKSLDQAVELVGSRSPEPLAREFRVCAKQLAMGLSMPAVMRSLVSRVQLADVRIFTATLSVHRQTGGDVAKVLERLAAVIRERLNYRRQLRAMTGAGRLSAVLVGMIGPLLFIYMFFFHSQYVQAMMESPLGQALLISAIVLEAIGLAWTARLLRPTY